MAGVGEEGAAVGDHAHELAQQSQVGEGVKLALHAVLGVEVPPGGAELHFAGDAAVLEVAQHGGDQVVVHGVVVVEDCLGQVVVAVEAVEKLG